MHLKKAIEMLKESMARNKSHHVRVDRFVISTLVETCEASFRKDEIINAQEEEASRHRAQIARQAEEIKEFKALVKELEGQIESMNLQRLEHLDLHNRVVEAAVPEPTQFSKDFEAGILGDGFVEG